MSQEYFAAQEARDLIGHLNSKYGLSTSGSGLARAGRFHGLSGMWERNYKAYYSNNLEELWSESGIRRTGEQGELIKMSVNQARSLVGEFNSLIGKNRLAFEAISGPSDAKTLTSSRLANAIAEQEVIDKKVDLKRSSLLEFGAVLGSGFIVPTWDNNLGDLTKAIDGQMIPTGDVRIDILSPDRVYYDYLTPDFFDLDHVLIETSKNRWDLIAQFPQFKKELMSLPAARRRLVVDREDQNDDTITVWEFYHRSSPALPNGRLSIFACEKTVFFDDENPYGFIPVIPYQPQKILGTGIGYPIFTELLPLQEMLDASFSTIASNQAAFGVQTITVANQSDIGVQDLGGCRFLKYNMQANGGGEPKSLDLLKTPPEIFKFADMLRSHLMELAKVNSALRGAPPPGVTSGTAIATLTTNALEFAAAASLADNIAMETLMNYIFRIYHKFGKEEKIVFMLGRNKQTVAKKWTGLDIADVKRVKLKLSNPLAKTAAGRMTITEHYMQMGFIKSPEDYAMVQETGSLEVATQGIIDEEAWILDENDSIRDGLPVQAISIERHSLHIEKHKTLFFDSLVRDDPQKHQALASHILEHVELAKNTDPYLQAIIETGKLPPPPPPGQPQGVSPEMPPPEMGAQNGAPPAESQNQPSMMG